MRLKRYVWELLATLVDRNFKKEYTDALKFDVQLSLKNLLSHAASNVPYYHRVLRKVGVIENENVNLANFEKIPILTKEMIRKRARELTSVDFEKRKWFYNQSGGSTGEPLKLIQDRLFLKWIDASCTFYYKDILGIDENFVKEIILWGARGDIFGDVVEFSKRMVDNFLRNKVWLDAFRMSEATMRQYVRIINSYKPAIIRGYAGSLYELARFVEREGLSIFSPKVVVSTAETLHEKTRKKIENVFDTKVYDFYGSREVDGMAGECKCGLLHMFASNNYIEVLDSNNQKVKEDEEGRIVVTTLHNFSMPLIRYDIGDMAVLGPTKCKCGSPLPTLKKITGRQIDYFVRKDRKIVYGGYFIELFWSQDWIDVFSVIQEDYKRIRILIVLRNGISNETKKKEIEEEIKMVMGKDCEVTWEVVDEIPETRTGKYLHVQSLLRD